jgi:hypothetical protein
MQPPKIAETDSVFFSLLATGIATEHVMSL